MNEYESYDSAITKVSSWIPYVNKFDDMKFAQDYSYNTLEQRLCPSCIIEIVEQELSSIKTETGPEQGQTFSDETSEFAEYLIYLYTAKHVDLYYFDTLSPNIIGHTVDESH